MKIKTLVVSAALILSSNLAISGQVYKWTDENGQIHYSDKQPNNVDSKKLKVSGGKQTSSRESAQDKNAALEERKQKQLEKQAEALQASNRQQEIDRKCQAIRDNLKKIEENTRIRIQKDGETRYLTTEEIEERKQRYAEQLANNC